MISKKHFEKWFRDLSTSQMCVFLLAVGFSVCALILNNPFDGYTRTFTYVKTQSLSEALINWDMSDPARAEFVAELKAKDRNGIDPEFELVTDPEVLKEVERELKAQNKTVKFTEESTNYLYRKLNPWWWIYSYESEAFLSWEYEHWGDKSLLRFRTLGTLINYFVFVWITAMIAMWLCGIRASKPKSI